MHSFVYEPLPTRAIFAELTAARLGEEAERLGMRRALVLVTAPREAEGRAIEQMLGERAAGVFAGAVMHTPVDVTDEAIVFARARRADGVVALGGGSTTGLGKAIALHTDLPQIVVPTTYAGSEMTDILGQTKDGVKTTLRSRKVLPETVIYDVARTMGLPRALSASSGMNAIAHAAEALYAKDGNPIVTLMAEAAIGALAQALPRIVDDPTDREARSEALYGAWLCGACLGSVSMAIHHKLCHTLGGAFNLPHAETHAILLPHAVAYNAAAAPDAMERLARALGAAEDPARALHALSARLGISGGLEALGMPESGIERAADLAVQNPYWNPQPIDRASIRELLARAWAGAPPRGTTP